MENKCWQAVDRGDKVAEYGKKLSLSTTKQHNSDGIKPPRDFHGNFPALCISHISIHEKSNKGQSGRRGLIKHSEPVVIAIKLIFVGQTIIVINMVVDLMWIKILTNKLYAGLVVLIAWDFFKCY